MKQKIVCRKEQDNVFFELQDSKKVCEIFEEGFWDAMVKQIKKDMKK